MIIKRYDSDVDDRGYSCMGENEEGDYILHEDHLSEIKAKNEALEYNNEENELVFKEQDEEIKAKDELIEKQQREIKRLQVIIELEEGE